MRIEKNVVYEYILLMEWTLYCQILKDGRIKSFFYKQTTVQMWMPYGDGVCRGVNIVPAHVDFGMIFLLTTVTRNKS